MYGSTRARLASPAAREARTVLVDLLTAVAQAGRLTSPVGLAAPVVEAACVGATLQALRDGYDPAVSSQLRDTVIGSLTSRQVESARGPAALGVAANRLAARLDGLPPGTTPLKPTELALFREWLTALAASAAAPALSTPAERGR